MSTRTLKLRSTKSVNLQQGLAAVEFTIMLPLLLLIALAITELGRGLYQYNTLSKAVHDGARYLSDRAVNNLGVVDITGYEAPTKNLVICGTLAGECQGDELLKNFSSRGSVTVTPESITMTNGEIADFIKVSATYTFDPLFDGLSALGYSMVPDFTATAVERALKI